MNLSKVIELINPSEYHCPEELDIREILPLDSNDHNAQSLTWVNEKNLDVLDNLNGTSMILPLSAKNISGLVEMLKSSSVNLFFVEKPRLAFSNLTKEFSKSQSRDAKIESSSSIDESVTIGKSCYIGHNVVIEKNCTMGDNCVILHNTVILEGTLIGNNVSIGSNCTIGGIGFGYELNESGYYESISHLGKVEIKDKVEIGNNTAIDRAVLGSTLIGLNVKIDNLVHIAHGVKIGDNSLIIANSMIAGSTVIEENVWVAPSASVLNKLKIGRGALIGMGAVVIKNVEDNSIVAGNPGKFLKSRND